jgi:CheY-like chemotaxis protein
LLQWHGFVVNVFNNPLLALKHFRRTSEDYVIIVSDIKMPGMSGFEFVRNVRETDSNIKIILMTSFDLDNVVYPEFFSPAMVNAFLQKPINTKALRKILESLLAAKPLIRYTT